jgi:uncharacterized protein YndB with AHSA1/START domain
MPGSDPVTDLGTVTRQADRFLIRYERRLAHPVERVWAAVTEPDRLGAWMAAASFGAAGEARAGAPVELRWQNAEGGSDEPPVARGTVSAYDPPRLVEYDTDVHGRLRFELEPVGGGTLLVFTVAIAMPEEHLSKNVAGWHIHLEHLQTVLDGGAVDWPGWYSVHFPRWEEIHAAYAAAR